MILGKLWRLIILRDYIHNNDEGSLDFVQKINKKIGGVGNKVKLCKSFYSSSQSINANESKKL